MKGSHAVIGALAIRILCLVLITSGFFFIQNASGVNLPYSFGSKVFFDDFDAGDHLNHICINIGYRDVGEIHNALDQMDPVYLDIDRDSIADRDDIRVTPFSIFGPGSKIKPGDPDIYSSLLILYNWSIAYSDTGSNDFYDIVDPVYLHNMSFGHIIAPGDIRLSSSADFPAGTRVRGSDGDAGGKALDLINGNDYAEFSFYNANGNFRPGISDNSSNAPASAAFEPIYDSPDRFYLDISQPAGNGGDGVESMGIVDANDLRLSN